MLDDIKAFIGFLGVISVVCILIVGVCFAPLLGIAFISEKMYCNTQQELSPDWSFHWGFWTGCLIELEDGTWANAHTYLNTNRSNILLDIEEK